MPSITPGELNYIIFRYLQESGFLHTAFTFGYEAGINNSEIDGNLVPPTALIKLTMKGLQYMEMEANLSDCDNEVDEDFINLQLMDLITKDVHELQKIVKDKKKNQHVAGEKELDKENEGAKGKAREDRGKQNMEKEGKDRDQKGSKRIKSAKASERRRNRYIRT